ncbi:MAG: hypothetical protein AB7S92_09825 [Parvibaculaceae bacterium]
MPDAVVIPFPKRAPSPPPAQANANRPAQIIIFPGVRYMIIPDETEDLFAIATAPLKRPSKVEK